MVIISFIYKVLDFPLKTSRIDHFVAFAAALGMRDAYMTRVSVSLLLPCMLFVGLYNCGLSTYENLMCAFVECTM
jgi:uncharacterized membrane protein YiaA